MKGIATLYKHTICDPKKHYALKVDFRCCGNCRFYIYDTCQYKYSNKSHATSSNVCVQWKFDGYTNSERMI